MNTNHLRNIGRLVAPLLLMVGNYAYAADESTDDLLKQAAEARGEDYFKLKAALVARPEEAQLSIRRMRATEKPTVEQQLLAKAISEAIKPSDKDLTASEVLQGVAGYNWQDPHPVPNHAGKITENGKILIQIYSADPRKLPADSPARRFFDKANVRNEVLYEILAKQTEETWLNIAVKEYVAQRETLIKEQQAQALAPHPGISISFAPSVTEEEMLKMWTPSRKILLERARKIAMRMLVLSNEPEAVPLLRELAQRKETQKDALQSLVWIGTEPAVVALTELQKTIPEAKDALEKLNQSSD